MKIFSKSISNEILLLGAITNLKYETPYQNFDDIFFNVSGVRTEKFDEETWKIEGSVFFKNNIGAPYSTKTYIDKMTNFPIINKKTFGFEKKDEAFNFAQKLIKNNNITISPNDINSIYAVKDISDIAQLDNVWDKLNKFQKLTIEETHSGDIFKLYIIKGKVAAIYGVLPAFVVGNGVSTIEDLIQSQNKERSQNILYKNYPIKNINSKISKKTILDKGEVLKLKETTKISNGAVLLDLTNSLKSKFCGLVDTFDSILKEIDYLVLTCISDDFGKGWDYRGFKVQEIQHNKADFAEFLSCANTEEKINNCLSNFNCEGVKNSPNNILEKCKIFKNNNLRSGEQIDILKEAAYRKGLKITHLEPSVILLEDVNTNKKITFSYCIPNKTNFYVRAFTNDKFKTKSLLQNKNINTPKGFKISVNSSLEAWEKTREFKAPIVVKPLDGSGGVGVSTNITKKEDFLVAWEICKKLNSKTILVEEYVLGNDYRIIVIGNKVCAVTQRIAAYVIGDGVNSISNLIKIREVERNENPYLASNKVQVNDILIHYLAQQGLTLESIPKENDRIQLLDVVNIGAGGESIDRTDEIHQDWIDVSVLAKKAVLDPFHVGLDLMAEDIRKSPHDQKWSIIEINTSPSLGLQVFPKTGSQRDVATTILDNLFEDNNPNIVTYNFSIYGKVQGVGYRKWLKRICDLRSVTGSVKNSENSINRVDVVISGPCETLRNVMELCYKGPQYARVKKICFTQEYTNTKFEEFLIIN